MRSEAALTSRARRAAKPDYFFWRKSDIERESGLILAGVLVTPFSKERRLSKRNKKEIHSAVEQVYKAVAAGTYPVNGMMYLWRGGKPDAPTEELPAEVLRDLAIKHVKVEVRIPSDASARVKWDRDLLRAMGAIQEH